MLTLKTNSIYMMQSSPLRLVLFTAILDSQQLVNGNRVRVKHIEELLTQLYINIQENKSFFLTIMDNNFNEHFRKRLAEIIEEKICDDFFRSCVLPKMILTYR